MRRRAFPALLPVVGPLTLLAGGLVVARTWLIQPDTWVALASGREVAHHGIPSVEHLTLLAQGRRWVDQQWLGQLTLYGVERLGGVGLVVALGIAAYLAAVAIAGAAGLARGASPAALIFWLPAAFVADPPGALVRTQSLALPLFSILLWLILRDPDCRFRSSLWSLPVLCLWANVHGSVALGAVLVVAHGLQCIARGERRRLPVAMVVLAPLTVLASPYAFSLPGYYHRMLLDPPYGHQIVEWRRTTLDIAPTFFAMAGVCALVLLLRWRRMRLVDWVVLGLTFAAALSAVRLTVWFGLAFLAILPTVTSRSNDIGEFRRRRANAIAAAMLLACVSVLAWTAGRADYERSGTVAALLRREPPSARVLANYTLADWVLWEAPNLRGRVELDARAELLTRHEWHYVDNFAPAIVRSYTLVVTNQRAVEHQLVENGRWAVAGAGGGVEVLRRSTA